MLTKTKIFKDIQKILREDYSGCVEKASVNRPEDYYVTDVIPDDEFESLIQSYLLDFKDGHLWFTHKDSLSSNIGFRVRRYGDELYVIKADEEKRIEVKDKILLMTAILFRKWKKGILRSWKRMSMRGSNGNMS